VDEASAVAAENGTARPTPIALELGPAGLAAPSLCACCMSTASHPLRVAAPNGPSVLVHYCDACHAHATGARTGHFAVLLASLFVGVSVAFALLVSWGSFAVPLQMMAALVGAALPFAVLLRRKPRRGHASRAEAVWLRGTELVCENRRYALTIAREHGLAHRDVARARPPLPRWLVLPFVVSVFCAPVSVRALGCRVRVLNRTEEPASVLVDGRVRGVVPPTSAESPWAGLELELVSGERQLSLVSRDGRVLADVSAGLRPGIDHLFVVSTTPACFWLERADYGRLAPKDTQRVVREYLTGEGPLWALPHRVDSWFAPNPDASGGDERSSGGQRFALRQGRCPVGSRTPAIILPRP
jgi:hypothetical protein